MIKHLKYLIYVLNHKRHVLIECCKLGIPWLGVTHDLSKFSRAEWEPYVERFFGNSDNIAQISFAWDHHWRQNPHHWQHWIEQDDEGEIASPMPDKYRREMLADLIALDKVRDALDARTYYKENKDKINLHPETRAWIEEQLK